MYILYKLKGKGRKRIGGQGRGERRVGVTREGKN